MEKMYHSVMQSTQQCRKKLLKKIGLTNLYHFKLTGFLPYFDSTPPYGQNCIFLKGSAYWRVESATETTAFFHGISSAAQHTYCRGVISHIQPHLELFTGLPSPLKTKGPLQPYLIRQGVSWTAFCRPKFQGLQTYFSPRFFPHRSKKYGWNEDSMPPYG